MPLLPPPGSLGDAQDLAGALSAVSRAIGHRPLLTVLHTDHREEQSATSLAQWAAKGAHLLALDLLLEPGDRLGLQAPLGWPAVTVLLAAWWSGIEVTLDADATDIAAAVVHEDHQPPSATEILWLGDGIDGGPADPTRDAWTRACHAFPDAPPAPSARGEATALEVAGRREDQTSLLTLARAMDTRGTLGIDLTDRVVDVEVVVAAAVRPLLAGVPTLLLRGADRTAATGERVACWR